MRPVRATIEIEAPVSTVWPLIAEYRHWPTWGPTVVAVRAETAAVAVGARGHLRTPIGVWLPFEITAAEPFQHWDWRVAGLPATGHRIAPIGNSRTRVEFTVSGWLAPYLVVLKAGLRRLKLLAETGKSQSG